MIVYTVLSFNCAYRALATPSLVTSQSGCCHGCSGKRYMSVTLVEEVAPDTPLAELELSAGDEADGSCSLLHEVMAVESGTRFALLGFVYGDS